MWFGVVWKRFGVFWGGLGVSTDPWLSRKSMTPNFVVVVSVLLQICCHIGSGMPYVCIFVDC